VINGAAMGWWGFGQLLALQVGLADNDTIIKLSFAVILAIFFAKLRNGKVIQMHFNKYLTFVTNTIFIVLILKIELTNLLC